MNNSVIDIIEKMASQVAEREGVQLYDVELVGGANGRTLRVYIDRDGSGVGVDDCANVSRGLSLLLDVEDPIPGGKYDLEVSSPGLDRKLRKSEHYAKAVGQKAEFRLLSPLGQFGYKTASMISAKKFEAQITSFSVENQTVEVEVNNEKVHVPVNVIERAKLVYDLEKNKGQKKKFNQPK